MISPAAIRFTTVSSSFLITGRVLEAIFTKLAPWITAVLQQKIVHDDFTRKKYNTSQSMVSEQFTSEALAEISNPLFPDILKFASVLTKN